MGFVSLEAAWAMGAEPRPASFENTPRLTPHVIAMIIEPTTPPVTPEGVKAPLNIIAKTLPMLPMLAMITARQATIYTTLIKGTSFSVTLPRRLIPPSRTSAAITAIAMPTTRLTVCALSKEGEKALIAVLMELVMLPT